MEQPFLQNLSEKKDQQIFPERISKQELQVMPLLAFTGCIHLVTTVTEMKCAIEVLSEESLLGFDTETRPTFKRGKSNPVALLQLSCDSDAYLFRLNEIGLPSQLIDLIKDPSTKKIGLAVHDDIKALQQLNAFEPCGFIDIADIARNLGIVTTGLRNLSGIVLGSRISKRSQLSNWERKVLDENQKLYAATDAWVCREMYCRLYEAGYINLYNLSKFENQNEVDVKN